jgi:hypothetical protein
LEGGAIACDLVEERAHVLGITAAWVLASVADSPLTLGHLIREAVAATGAPDADVELDLVVGLDALRSLGLVDRTEPFSAPKPLTGSPRPGAGRATGGVHAVIDHGIAFRSTDPGLLAEVDDFLGTAVDGRPADLYFDVDLDGPDGIALDTADQWRFPSRSAFFAQLPGVVNEYAARSNGTLVFHAGALRTPDGRIVLVPGHIDAGKSTVVAGMVRLGCDYLGDESIGVRGGSLHAIGYPKPFTLDPTSRAVLSLPPSDEPHLSVDEVRAGTARLAGDVGPIDLILLPEYRGPRPSDPSPVPVATHAVRLPPVEAAQALLANVLNLSRAGEAGLTALCQLAESVPTVRVDHQDSLGLAREVVEGTFSERWT